ncbi:MAG: undecaprenyl/decaprenyl-phosphate alpha-N-acetylglucosaminyl 1-phosphate transferase [Planctomyces sp.]|nr:undecaprenyl/decaprenyl-phosphate alpha-N-acetylglucosaminyl 1-phosphate transferase [Planctomyces sp.]
MNPSLLSFVVALASSVVLAPLIARVAQRLGVIDHPDGHRKLHAKAVPLTGGPTILIAGIIAVLATIVFSPDILTRNTDEVRFLLCLLAASTGIVILGVIDDRFGLRGRQKLVGQFVVALAMLPSGIMIEQIEAFGVTIELGDLSAIVTLFWILGAVNALNLIDGVDGLASTTGIVLSLSVAAVTYVTGGHSDGLMMSLVLAGTICGFLIYNFPPARMFLGDSGSMLIGLVLGCVALKCSIKQYTAAALIMPTAIWAIPIFDVAMAIVRRKLTGQSIYATDRGHIHHCLQRKGANGRVLLLIVGTLCAITGIGAVLAAAMNNEFLAVVGVLTAIALLVATRSFGHAELRLLTTRVRRFAGSMVLRPTTAGPVLHDEQVRMHGDHQWEELWITLTAFAEQFEMDRVELMVNVPSVGEEYHATWRRKSKLEHHDAWRSEIPLVVEGMKVGQIRVVGAIGEGSICEWMSELILGLRPFEDQLVSLIEELKLRKAAERKPKSKSAVFTLPQQVHA